MIVFLSCVKSKRQNVCAAKDMYVSDMFKKSLAYAETLNAKKIYILSAKYGLLELNDIIEPYNLTLNNMTEKQRKEWAYRVCKQCERKGIKYNEKIIFLCGENYRKYLMTKFQNSTAPLKNLGIGRQLSFYKKALGLGGE